MDGRTKLKYSKVKSFKMQLIENVLKHGNKLQNSWPKKLNFSFLVNSRLNPFKL